MTRTPDATALDELCVTTIRTLSMDGVQAANSGHPGTPMALAPLAYALYARHMRHSPVQPHWPARDRFVLSCGHASMLLYSTLHLSGYRVSLDDLKRFRQLGSITAGHPEFGHVEGVETTTGPLGQGLATAVGLALGERLLAERFNRPGHDIAGHRTYVIASDGDLQEGVSGEASSLAGHLGLGRLVCFYDDNHISIEGDTSLSFSEDVGARYEAYGWHVQRLGEDLGLDRLLEALDAADADERPSLIVVRTHIAQGSPNKQDTHGAHGAPLGEEEVRLTKQAYGFPSEEPFFVPDEVGEHFTQAVKQRGEELVDDWTERFEAYKAEFPELANEFERLVIRRDLPEAWDAEPLTFDVGEGSVATRKASQKAIQWVAGRVPELLGGSADLAPSNLTLIDGADSVERGAFAGRNLHFGIREFGMGAVVNGLALQGLRSYGATFLIFSDYMKAAVRLGALMGLPTTWVWTHDSIGVGEDGPTHQPIEQLAGLRAIPNLHVFRPGDPNETVAAWRAAVNRTSGPSALALSRQGVPTMDPATVDHDGVARGAYVVRDGDAGVLIGTGTELHLALEAADLLASDGMRVRVVSMPCMDAFAEQDAAYRERVLPPALTRRVAVEAASSFGWHRWIGDRGAFVGMDGFGASGPAKQLFEHFGITAQAVADAFRKTTD